MKRRLAEFFVDESGVTAIEYGMIVAVVAVAVITAMEFLGASLSNIFEAVAMMANTAIFRS